MGKKRETRRGKETKKILDMIIESEKRELKKKRKEPVKIKKKYLYLTIGAIILIAIITGIANFTITANREMTGQERETILIQEEEETTETGFDFTKGGKEKQGKGYILTVVIIAIGIGIAGAILLKKNFRLSRNINIVRVTSKIVVAIIGLYAGGVVMNTMGTAMNGTTSAYNQGLVLTGWTVNEAGTITATPSTALLAVIGLIGIASVIMEFARFRH